MTAHGENFPWRRIRAVAGAVVLAAVCLLAFLVVVLPLLLGAQSYTVLTGSMRPALEPGHLIAVRATPIEDIRIGDIVTYQLESGKPAVVTHRVVGVGYSADGERLLTTQGDDNNVADALPVQEVQVRGVLVYALPWAGYVNVWATPAIKSVVVTVVGVLAISWGVIVLLRDAHRRRRAARALAGASAVAALVLVGVGIAPAAPAEAAQTDSAPADALLLSADGRTWTPGPTLTLVDGIDDLVPGDSTTVALWVRNASPDDAEFRVDSAWLPYDPADPDDRALADTLGVMASAPRDLAAGDSTPVPLVVALEASSPNASRLGAAVLQVTVTLTATVSPPVTAPTDDPLAPTGAELPLVAGIVGGALVLGGVVLMIIRRTRRDRRDE